MSLPTYNHSFTSELINYYDGLPKEKIDEGLALPRQTFIEDLENLITDIQTRREYYYQQLKDKSIDDEQLLVRYIINFLSILEAKQSLPKLVEVINEDREFVDFWFGDFIDESYVTFVFYPLFKDNFDFLLETIFNKKSQLAVQAGILDIPAQVAIKEPHRRQEAIDFYKRLIEFVLTQKKKDCILDEFELDTVIHSILLIEGKELKEQIIELYEKKLIKNILSPEEEVIKELENPKISIRSDKKIDLELTPYEIFERTVGHNYNCEFTKEEQEEYEKRAREIAAEKGIDLDSFLKGLDEIDFENEDEDYDWIEDNLFVNYYDPKTDKPLYGRNDKVSVKYEDGKILENVKYKKVEKDVKEGKCEIIK